MQDITNIGELSQLVKQGCCDWKQYGDVNTVEYNDLILFNYTQACQYTGRWNAFERMSRGLILNRNTGEVIARPFEKFFNYGERGYYPEGYIVNVYEKLDGSLGILYRHNGELRIATRGSFTSDQALWATAWLQQHPSYEYLKQNLNAGVTLLFEIIYPENRIVVDYSGYEGLVLLAIRNLYSGDYRPFFPEVYALAEQVGFRVPKYYTVNSVTDLIEMGGRETDVEGWVMEFSSGERAKLKTDWYKELHRFVTNVSFKRVLEAAQRGEFDAFVRGIPEEYLEQVRAWHCQIEDRTNALLNEVQVVYQQLAPKDASKEARKAFAKAIFQNHKPLSQYLFAQHDGKPVRDLILRHEFEGIS